MMNYSWLTLSSARTQLAARLADPNMVKWTSAELTFWITDALRQWNALTSTWKTEYTFNPTTNWNALGALANSPRLRTVTDTQVYTLMQYALTEPPTGGTWTGTSQFSIADLSGALQRRRDEIIQVANCNQAIINPASTPNVRRGALPDTTIEPQRVRFLPTDSAHFPPVTLSRSDQVAEEFFEPDFPNETPAMPQEWMVASEPPLAFNVDVAPSVAGKYEVVALQSGVPFTPPAANLLGIPDDFAWLARYGALADLLGRESDATDLPRAQWCQKRYMDGLKLIASAPWIFLASVNGVPVDVSSMTQQDCFWPEWDSDPNFWPTLVTAGMDFFWVPTTPAGNSIGMTVIGNAPCPILDADFIQVSRSVWDAVLSMAQFLCAFKMGGAEFSSAMGLEKIFIQAAEQEGQRLSKLGIFSDVLNTRSTSEIRQQERW
ncbi:MAG: hypothetical protein JWQ87_10 [Candidatus Sulfotelmatobacter sp.]|nr:hypothetical protein [Candidatus Sulfotelmatobacter sp.]